MIRPALKTRKVVVARGRTPTSVIANFMHDSATNWNSDYFRFASWPVKAVATLISGQMGVWCSCCVLMQTYARTWRTPIPHRTVLPLCKLQQCQLHAEREHFLRCPDLVKVINYKKATFLAKEMQLSLIYLLSICHSANLVPLQIFCKSLGL